MQIKSLNKALLVATLTLSFAACNNSTATRTNSVSPTEVQTEDNSESDIIEESIKDADENKAADSEKKEDTKIDTETESKDDSKEVKDNDTVENPEDSSPVDEVKEEDMSAKKEDKNEQTTNTDQTNNNDDTNYQTNDGYYSSTLIASKEGAREPETSMASICSVEASNDTLTVKGSIDYRLDPNNYENINELENTTYNFKINENTKFQAVSGLADPEIFTAEEFNQYYSGITESGLALIVEVKDGVAQTVSFSS